MITFIFLLIFPAFASVKDLPSDRLTLGFGFGMPKLNLSIIGPTGNKAEFEPNVSSQTIIGASYGFFGASYGFKHKEPANPELNSTTSFDDYQFRFFFDELILEAFYQKYTGYFIKNSSAVVGSSSTVELPNLESTKHFLSATYTFDSDNFSLNHPFSTDKIQTKSGGSWLMQANITHTTLDNNDEAIIPSSSSNNYGKMNLLKKQNNFLIAFGPGYGYNFIYGGFYTNLTILLMPTLQKFTLDYTDNTSDKKDKFDLSSGAIKAAMGWNYERYKFGIEVYSDNTSAKLETKEQIDVLTVKVGLMFHYRF